MKIKSKWKSEVPVPLIVAQEQWAWWRKFSNGRAIMCKLVESKGGYQVTSDDLPKIRGPRWASEMGGEWLVINRPKPTK